MLIALFDLYLALNLKGFNDWDPKAKALVAIIGGVLLIILSIAFIRKVGVVGILVPTIIIGAIYTMNQNSGCLGNATDANEEGTYEKGKIKKPTSGTPAPGTPTTPPPAK